jgi:hypothetical protein
LRRTETVVRSRYLLDGGAQSGYGGLLVELLAEKLGVCTQQVHVSLLALPTASSRRMLSHPSQDAPEDDYTYNVTVQYPTANESIPKTFFETLEQSVVFYVEHPSATPTPEPVDPSPSTGGTQKGGGLLMPVAIGVVSCIVVAVGGAFFYRSYIHSRIKGMAARPSAFDMHPPPQNSVFYPSVFHGAYAEAGPTCFEVAEGGVCAACINQQCAHCAHCAQAAARYPLVFL